MLKIYLIREAIYNYIINKGLRELLIINLKELRTLGKHLYLRKYIYITYYYIKEYLGNSPLILL